MFWIWSLMAAFASAGEAECSGLERLDGFSFQPSAVALIARCLLQALFLQPLPVPWLEQPVPAFFAVARMILQELVVSCFPQALIPLLCIFHYSPDQMYISYT